MVCLFPAIDLKGGHCVRLKKGQMDKKTVFHKNPAAQAEIFKTQGFGCIHVVDLDGAVEGRSVNGAAVESILSCGLPIQLGGGIRTMQHIEQWLQKGVKRVVLGTAAQTLQEAYEKFPGQVAAALDMRGDTVAINGWLSTRDVFWEDFGYEGAAAIIWTDIERDGMKTGVDVARATEMAQKISRPLIVSGGVARLEDLKDLR